MSDFKTVRGFEDIWRPPVMPLRRSARAILTPRGDGLRAKVVRVVNRATEVMVKVTGRTREAGHARAHLDYISRNGAVELEDRDGAILSGRSDVKEVAEGWAETALLDSRRRAGTPFTHSIVLSMPAQTEATAVRDAARAFAQEVFAERHDYVFALHTDADHPHVHIAVRSRGDDGSRLNPKKADLWHWREVFAERLRERGVEAEATRRRVRGVTRKPERMALRQMRERHEAGRGEPARVRRAAWHEASRAAFGPDAAKPPWETRLIDRQASIRSIWLAQARLLLESPEPADRALGVRAAAFVRAMPAPDTQRLAMARELRAAATKATDRSDGERRGRDR